MLGLLIYPLLRILWYIHPSSIIFYFGQRKRGKKTLSQYRTHACVHIMQIRTFELDGSFQRLKNSRRKKTRTIRFILEFHFSHQVASLHSKFFPIAHNKYAFDQIRTYTSNHFKYDDGDGDFLFVSCLFIEYKKLTLLSEWCNPKLWNI